MITYARIACVHEQTKDAFNALKDAVSAGYNDIGFITKNPDFLGLKRDAARATAYLKPQFTITWVQPTTAKVVPKAINTNRIEIKNDSPFTLTGIRISATFEVKGNVGKPIPKALTIKELPKGEKYDWDVVFNGAPGSLYRMKITIECDQGKYTTEKVEIRK